MAPIALERNLYKSELKSLILLALPTIFEEILQTVVQYVDIAMVGRLGEKAIASVSLTGSIGWLTGSVFSAFAVSVVALTSSAIGEQDYQKIKQVSKLSVYFTVVTSVIMLLLSLIAAPFIPRFMGAERDIWDDAITYYVIITIPMFFRSASRILSSSIRATKNTKTPMLINLSANCLNIFLNYFLIYRFSLGVRGAAIASALSYTLSGTLMFVFFQKNKLLHVAMNDLKISKDILKNGLDIAFPSLMTSLVSCFGYVAFASLVSSMGTTLFASHSIAVQAEEIVYIPGYGLRSATSVLVGVSYGERNEKKFSVTVRNSVALTVLMMSLSGALLYIFSNPFMRVFTTDMRIIEKGSELLRLISFSEPFFGLMIVSQGIFYGLGKTRYTFIVEAISMWGVRILFTFLAVKIWHLGLKEVWYCMIADNVLKALLLFMPLCFYKKDRLFALENNK